LDIEIDDADLRELDHIIAAHAVPKPSTTASAGASSGVGGAEGKDEDGKRVYELDSIETSKSGRLAKSA
jgi:hypothetical protein